MYTISIIVPVYNVESYIERCIRSIQGQTLQEFECLIIDDASPDNSIPYIRPLIEKDTRFRVIHHNKNQGLGPARNTGIRHASAEYLCFVDSDDYIESNFLKVLYNSVIDNNSDMAVCAYYVVKNTLRKITRKMSDHTWHSAIRNILIGKDLGEVWFRIYKKNLFQKIQFPTGYYEDCATIFKLIIENKITFIPHGDIPVYNYVKRTMSITYNITLRHIYYSFRNVLVPIITMVDQNKNIESIYIDLSKFLLIRISISMLQIHRFSQNFLTEFFFLSRLIKKYIPLKLLHRIQFRFIVDKEILRAHGLKRVAIYVIMYISHVKFGIISLACAFVFHKIFRALNTIFHYKGISQQR